MCQRPPHTRTHKHTHTDKHMQTHAHTNIHTQINTCTHAHELMTHLPLTQLTHTVVPFFFVVVSPDSAVACLRRGKGGWGEENWEAVCAERIRDSEMMILLAHTHTDTHTDTHVHICIRTHTYTHIPSRTRAHTHWQYCLPWRTHAHTHTHLQCCLPWHTRTHPHRGLPRRPVQGGRV